jgi:hypothetical protein
MERTEHGPIDEDDARLAQTQRLLEEMERLQLRAGLLLAANAGPTARVAKTAKAASPRFRMALPCSLLRPTRLVGHVLHYFRGYPLKDEPIDRYAVKLAPSSLRK